MNLCTLIFAVSDLISSLHVSSNLSDQPSSTGNCSFMSSFARCLIYCFNSSHALQLQRSDFPAENWHPPSNLSADVAVGSFAYVSNSHEQEFLINQTLKVLQTKGIDPKVFSSSITHLFSWKIGDLLWIGLRNIYFNQLIDPHRSTNFWIGQFTYKLKKNVVL